MEQVYEAPLLFNSLDPYYNIDKENAKHRVVLLLKAKGATNLEIASATGYCPIHVSNIVRQKWFQKQLVELLHAKGEGEIEKLLKVHATAALLKAVEIMENTKNEQLAATCAFNIFKTAAGQKLTVIKEVSNALDIDKEIERRQIELEELTGRISEDARKLN